MTEKPQRSLEERIAACPIHALVDVEDILDATEVPDKICIVVREILLIRGEYSISLGHRQLVELNKRIYDYVSSTNLLIREKIVAVRIATVIDEHRVKIVVARN